MLKELLKWTLLGYVVSIILYCCYVSSFPTCETRSFLKLIRAGMLSSDVFVQHLHSASPVLIKHWVATLGFRQAMKCPVCVHLLSCPAEMWYGVFLWALVSSLCLHIPAGLLGLLTLRHHKYGKFLSVSILLMGIVGPITAGILTSMLDAQKC